MPTTRTSKKVSADQKQALPNWEGEMVPVPTVKGSPLHHAHITGAYPVEIFQTGRGKYAVRYGLQLKERLSYEKAAKEFGQCVFHALACAGLIDNSR